MGYSAECLALSKKSSETLQSSQGGVMKQVCGLGKRSRHSALLEAMNIPPVRTKIQENTISMYKRICSVNSSTRDVCISLLNMYISDKIVIPGTLVERIVKMGLSPIDIINNGVKPPRKVNTHDGLVDSIRTILYEDNYLKPWSTEYLMLKLLTRSF